MNRPADNPPRQQAGDAALRFYPESSKAVANFTPPPQHGVNLWCLSAARKCALAGYTQSQAFDAIMSFAGQIRQGRSLSPQEVARAIATAYSTPHHSGVGSTKAKALSEQELKRLCPPIREEAAQEFVASSPEPRNLPSAEVLALLFKSEDCLGFKTQNACHASKCQVAELPSFFANAEQPFQFMTSSPISGRLGRTQNGGLSYVAKECFGEQRFVVVEFDSAPPAAQFARILWLKKLAAGHAQLVMMLRSGNRSIHAFFSPQSADIADKLKIAAVKVGADPAAMRIHQPVRCPNQLRDNGNLQEVLWLASPVPQK